MKWTLQWTVPLGNFVPHALGWLNPNCQFVPLRLPSTEFNGAPSCSPRLHGPRSPTRDPASPTCHNPHIDWVVRPRVQASASVRDFRAKTARIFVFVFLQTAPCVHAITCRRLSGLPQWSSDRQPSHVVRLGNLKEITGICVMKPQQCVQIYCRTKIGSKPQSNILGEFRDRSGLLDVFHRRNVFYFSFIFQ